MRTRVEDGYRNSVAKDEGFSPHISDKVARRITRYCKQNNLNRTRFVEGVLADALDRLEKEMLEKMSKEELAAMILQRWSEA